MTQTLPCLAVIFSLSLAGCTLQSTPSPNLSTQPATLENPATISRQPATIQGRLVVGNDASSLTPCASHAQFLLVLNREQQLLLANQIHYPYQELYAEIIGELQVPSQTGFNADYRARMLVTQIKSLGQDAIHGCATATESDTTSRWAASYQAQSQQENGLRIKLDLQANHLATTEYHYPDNLNPIIEQGFWQQLNPQQVEVVITRYQQQYLVTRRIFTRTGKTLHTDQEKIGQKLYPIRDGGITLFRVSP